MEVELADEFEVSGVEDVLQLVGFDGGGDEGLLVVV